jgi:5-formyltetrahydrofolate cyclo-ligase
VPPSLSKSALRAELRRRRLLLDVEAWASASSQLVRLLQAHERILGARSVALFWPISERREPDLRALDAWARANAKRVYYPFMNAQPDGLMDCGFGFTSAASDLGRRQGAVGPKAFLEPSSSRPAALDELDVIVTPALSIDDAGYRLGYGAGFYDRVLARHAQQAFRVGVCYASERVHTLEREAHDVAVDWIVTELESSPARR